MNKYSAMVSLLTAVSKTWPLCFDQKFSPIEKNYITSLISNEFKRPSIWTGIICSFYRFHTHNHASRFDTVYYFCTFIFFRIKIKKRLKKTCQMFPVIAQLSWQTFHPHPDGMKSALGSMKFPDRCPLSPYLRLKISWLPVFLLSEYHKVSLKLIYFSMF